MSYKVGDKFEIEISKVLESNVPFYKIKGAKNLVLYENDLSLLKQLNSELEIDWSKVEVDTPILVKFSEDGKWTRRHFAKFEKGRVYAWDNGGTSYTCDSCSLWNYAELAEKGGKE